MCDAIAVVPGTEAHGGYTYCGFASLSLLHSTHLCDIRRLLVSVYVQLDNLFELLLLLLFMLLLLCVEMGVQKTDESGGRFSGNAHTLTPSHPHNTHTH